MFPDKAWEALAWVCQWPVELHFPLESLKMPVKQVWKEIMVLERAWRMFQRSGEQEDASALQCPTVPMLAELGIIQQAVSLFVLPRVPHTLVYSREQKGE